MGAVGHWSCPFSPHGLPLLSTMDRDPERQALHMTAESLRAVEYISK